MRFLMRWIFRLVVLAIVLVVSLILLKDTILKSIAENRIRARTGMDARIGKFELALFRPAVTIENFRIYNTAEFGGSAFMEVPELHVEWNPRSLGRPLQFKLVRLALSEMHIVESKSGRTNLLDLLDRVEGGPKREKDHEGFGGIEVLNLTLGKVRYTNMDKPSRYAEVDMKMKNEIITDVKTVDELTDIILKILFRHGVTLMDQRRLSPEFQQPEKPLPSLAALR